MRLITSFILVIFIISASAQVGSKNFIDKPYIEVTGKAEMEVVPNEIYLKIIINERDYNGKKKLEEVEKSMIDSFVATGIDVAENLTIKDMLSNFGSYWLNKSKINSVKEYQLIVDKANTAGQVFQSLEALGISNISIDKVEHSDIEQFRTEVKVLAIKAAKTKAEALTQAVNQNIGKAIYIQETSMPVYRTFGQRSEMANISVSSFDDAGAQQAKINIEFEKIKLEYKVLVRFELL